ncbi:hypothetical protein BRAS3843_1070056 [Bradyrhizobium sp. STM 3843]|nr:hypothetical protein BRAS3843_1070056 [Bradyrhizobium sp. STM 3843]
MTWTNGWPPTIGGLAWARAAVEMSATARLKVIRFMSYRFHMNPRGAPGLGLISRRLWRNHPEPRIPREAALSRSCGICQATLG